MTSPPVIIFTLSLERNLQGIAEAMRLVGVEIRKVDG